MLVPILLFILGLVCLIKGGDWFVDGAVSLAHRFNLPEILIGATIVSIGTTLPEVMVSATSAAIGHGEIAYGNAIGSIICNTSLIAAITMAIKPAKIDKKPLKLPAVAFFVAAAVYMVISYFTKTFSRTVGIILLAMFVAYMAISVKMSFSDIKKSGSKAAVLNTAENLTAGKTDADAALKNKSKEKQSEKTEKPQGFKAFLDLIKIQEDREEPILKIIIFMVIGAALIAWGADLLVDNGTLIAEGAGVPESVIALTFVALGTSLPELVTAITSLAKGHGALSVGNIIGANLFNLVLVSGISIAIMPFDLPSSKMIMGLNSSLLIDLPLMAVVMLIMILPALIKGKLYRWQGILLLLLYAGFCVYQFS